MSTRERDSAIRTGDVLAVGTVPTVEGTTLQLRPAARRATILVLPHSDDCDGCRRYLDDVVGRRADLDRWQATLVVVLSSPESAAAQPTSAVADDDTNLRRRLGVAPGTAAVLVSDRHGQVWRVTEDPDGHDLPDVGELEQDVRFIAIQCPECDVPDIPGLGEWGDDPTAG